MPAITVEQFVAMFPAFKNTDVTAIAAAIVTADEDVDETRLGGRYLRAYGCAVAHYLVVGGADPADKVQANDVVTRADKTLSVSRDPALLQLQAVEPFARTTWGQEYLSIAREAGVGGAAV